MGYWGRSRRPRPGEEGWSVDQILRWEQEQNEKKARARARAEAVKEFESSARWPVYGHLVLTIYLVLTVVPLEKYSMIVEKPAIIGFFMIISALGMAITWGLFQAFSAALFGFTLMRMRRLGKRTDRILDLQTDGRDRMVYYWWGSKDRWWTVRSWKIKEDVEEWCKQSGIKILALPVRHGEEERPRIYFRRPADAVAFKMRWY